MRRLAIAAVLILVLVTLLTSVTQIEPGERAVVRRFGRILEEKPGAGLHFLLPFGIDQVERVKVNQVREVTIGGNTLTLMMARLGADNPLEAEEESATPPGQLLTGDHNLIDLQVKVYYSVIDDPIEIEKFALQSARVDELLARAAENALAEWAAGRPIEEVLLEGKRVLPLWLRDEVSRRIARYDLGVKIEPLPSVTHLNPPREVKPWFDAVAQAETEMETRLNRAVQFARQRAGEADTEALSSQSRVATYQARVRGQAHAEASGFLAEVKKKRDLPPEQVPAYLSLRWWTVMSRVYDQMQQTRRIRPLDDYLVGDTLQLNVPLIPSQK